MPLVSFLRASKMAWAALRSTPSSYANIGVHVVVGNQACDADSVISAVAFALYLHAVACTSLRASGPGAAPGCRNPSFFFLPVVSCARQDFVLRREAAYLLQEASPGTDEPLLESLVFLDDVDVTHLTELSAASKLRITLMDHNKLSGSWASANLPVYQIVDHHKDMLAHAVSKCW